MIRIGIVGLGFGERVHVPAFRSTGRFEVCALSSKTPGKAAEAAKRLSVAKAYDRWQDLLADPAVQVVSIATPPADQFDIALSAIGLGKAVFLEKPLTLDFAQSEELVREARLHHIPALIDFELCEIDTWLKAKELLDKNAIGPLRRIAVNWHHETYACRHKIDSWKLRTAEGGGALFQFGPHVFHYLEWFAGPIRSLSAHLDGQDKKPAADAAVSLSLEFENGASGTVSIVMNAFSGAGHRVELYGDGGAIVLENTFPDRIDDFSLRLSLRSGETRTWSASPAADGQDGRIRLVAGLARRLADWIESGKISKPSWEEGVRVQQLLDATHRSHGAQGRFVSLKRSEV